MSGTSKGEAEVSEKLQRHGSKFLVDSISRGLGPLQEDAPGLSSTSLWLRSAREGVCCVVEDAKKEIVA